jgi:CRISP-associated protein Cas1
MSSTALPSLPPPRPIPLKDRSSIIFIEKGNVDVLDGAFVVSTRMESGRTSRSAGLPA